jgi:glutamine cyclotransferase
VEQLRVEVLGSRPHDGQAFTQGLVWDDGTLYESTGLRGRSTVRRVNVETGQVEALLPLEPRFFGEGLALAGDRLVQITWQEGVALVYDRASLALVDTFAYSGEGWGLCYDGSRFVMSDGSSNLTFRDAHTFEALGTVAVTLRGRPVERLNELECVGDAVFANVWQTDMIVRIDARNGQVTADIDAAGLLSPADRAGADVLNGIAYDPGRDVFLITGKLWPRMFEVRFVH